jgi:uncharacterized membrane protein
MIAMKKEVASKAHSSREDHSVDVEKVLDELPAEARSAVISVLQQHITTFKGPIPPPEILKKYEEVCPGSPERILKIAEKQIDHRIKIESTIVNRRTLQNLMGQFIGALLVLFLGWIAFRMAMQGYTTLAGVILSTTIISLSVIFVLGKEPKIGNKEQKS